jgi:hypothetical protein
MNIQCIRQQIDRFPREVTSISKEMCKTTTTNDRHRQARYWHGNGRDPGLWNVLAMIHE